MIEIRGQQAADWPAVYAIRLASRSALPYIRPDWVQEELAKPRDGNWPLVAAEQLPEGKQVVARANLRLGTGRRGQCAVLEFEQHPDHHQAGRELLQHAIGVAERWWNKIRLEISLPAGDQGAAALFQSFGFQQEARLQQAVRIAGQLEDELVLARLSLPAGSDRPPDGFGPAAPAPPTPVDRNRPPPKVAIRGGSREDWEAFHTIWSQPSVYWGTMQIPYPSADWNRIRIQERAPERFWPLVAVVDDQVVGNSGLMRGEHHRSHAGHVGMMVHHDYQGMGIGSALLQAVIDLADNWLGLGRLQLEVYTDNHRAIDLYRKFGFEEEGILRADSYRDGHYLDTLVMGRLHK